MATSLEESEKLEKMHHVNCEGQKAETPLLRFVVDLCTSANFVQQAKAAEFAGCCHGKVSRCGCMYLLHNYYYSVTVEGSSAPW